MTDKTATQQAQASAAGAVIGINLGHSYASIACINQHGRADVIANEDGERQLATRISFNGNQTYFGNQATPQLVRNAHNTVDYFVNLLGRSYSELSESEKARTSSPVIDNNGVPSFKVEIDGKETILSVQEVTVKFLRSLFLTAKDFLSGVPISGSVLSIPLHYTSAQISALKESASQAGLIVLQLISSPASALTAYGLTSPSENGRPPTHPDQDGLSNGEVKDYPIGKELDRTVLVLDLGGTSTCSTLLSCNSGLYSLLTCSQDLSLGGRNVDDSLVEYLAKEFTKKTKIPIEKEDRRAWQKLRNEAEVTKRALSASGSAQCSVESLAQGCDFSASVNRVRLDMLARETYAKVLDVVRDSLSKAQLDPVQVDEVVLAGASSRLPGLIDQLTYVFPTSSKTVITSSIDPDQVLAVGAAVQAQVLALLSTYPDSSAPEKQHVLNLPLSPVTEIDSLKVATLKQDFGLVIPAPKGLSGPEDSSVEGQLFVTLLHQNTPLPVRRSFELNAPETEGPVLLEFAEGTKDVKVDLVQPEADDEEDDEEEDDEDPSEPQQVKSQRIIPEKQRKATMSINSKANAKIYLQLETAINGQTEILVQNQEGEKESITLPAFA